MSRAAWAASLVAAGLLASVYLDFRIMPNQSSRALPVMSLVEEGTSRIDRHHDVTEDKALVDGHYYSDKAPLSSWLVVPFYAALRPLASHLEPDDRLKVIISLGGFLCGTLPFLAALLLTLGACRRHLPPARALLLCLGAHFGSYLFVYAGTYFGHLLAGALLLAAYILLWDRPEPRRRPLHAGLLLGLAMLAEHPMALAAPVWGLQLWLRQRRARAPLLLGLGLVPSLLVLGLYNLSITGSPLDFPYQHVPNQLFASMSRHLGMGPPRLEALLGLTFGASRGLFVYSPVLLWMLALGAGRLEPGSLAARTREALLHPVAGLGLLMLLFFSGYYMWWGGWSYGPRHLLPLAMIWLYAGCQAAARGDAWKSGYLLAAAGYGVLLGWVDRATHGFLIPERYPLPPVRPLLSDFLDGNWSPFNLLSGYLGLSPKLISCLWLLGFAALAASLARAARREDPGACEEPGAPPVAGERPRPPGKARRRRRKG